MIFLSQFTLESPSNQEIAIFASPIIQLKFSNVQFFSDGESLSDGVRLYPDDEK